MLTIKTSLIIQQYVGWYGWPTWLFFGTIGCLLNILLFSRRKFRTISCCLYFLVASMAMLLALGIGLIPLIYAFNNPSPYNTISSFCKARNYLLQISAMMYRWLMVAACIDRYIHTSGNVYLQQCMTARMTIRIIVIIVISWLILPFHQIVWTDVQMDLCVFTNPTVGVYSSFFTIIFGGLLPPLIMLICTLLIRHNLLIKRARLDRHRNHVQQQPQRENQEIQVSRSRNQQALTMLFVQISVYIISNLPWTIGLAYTAYTRYMIKSDYQIAMDTLLIYLAQSIWYLYPVLSFYMYTLTSRTFRRELKKVLGYTLNFRCQCLPIGQRIQPAT